MQKVHAAFAFYVNVQFVNYVSIYSNKMFSCNENILFIETPSYLKYQNLFLVRRLYANDLYVFIVRILHVMFLVSLNTPFYTQISCFYYLRGCCCYFCFIVFNTQLCAGT